jgi:outer membrane protein assembly factor BamA
MPKFLITLAIMKLPSFAILSLPPWLCCVSLCCALVATAQSIVPKTIQFNGDNDYSNAELLAAAGLTSDEEIDTAKLNHATQQLLDTGLFEDIRFAYNDQLVAFQIIPAAAYPLRLENFPLNFGGDLESRLHGRFPLYRGKVPVSGALLNGVSEELQEELAAIKIPAAVSSSLYAEGNPGKIVAISFSITNPDVQIGEIKLGVLSATMVGKVRQLTSKLTGSAYSTDTSSRQLEASVTALYETQGYLEAKVHATAPPKPVIDAKGVHIPYTLDIDEGPQYKLASVQLAPDVIVPQATFDRLRGQQPGEIVSPEKLRRSCDFIAREYRKKGFLKAQVSLTPAYDRAHGTVSYLVTAQPGPVYTMGELKVENVDDDMREKIAAALPLPQGAPFNEGAIVGMTATHNMNPELERFFVSENLFYKLNLNDDAHTVDVDLTPEKKP